MMVGARALAMIGAMVTLAIVPGCASTCSATPEKLAALKRGMSSAEATSVMGCAGSPIGPRTDAPGEVSTIQWTGPGTVFTATDLDFQGDQLLYYVTRAKGGL
jgi:hypothetical protein